MNVKICGITNMKDALAAVEAGADLLGFNFYPLSVRYIDPHNCANIQTTLRDLGLKTVSVGVFVNASIQNILSTIDRCGLEYVQLSGDEPPEYLEQLRGIAWKSVRPAHLADLEQIFTMYPPRKNAPAWLVDAQQAGKYGGTGKRADWNLAAHLARQYPILLAGGLNPHNVAEAVQAVHPWGVDVASGVESMPGRKDKQKMIEFIRAAKAMQQENEYADRK